MSLGSIPWTAIDQYADKYEIVEWEYEYFVRLIEILDRAFLNHQPKAGTKGKGSKGKSNG